MAEALQEPSEDTQSEFQDLYKYSTRNHLYTLEKKRAEYLAKQKQKRTEAFNEKRNLTELLGNDEPQAMECEAVSKPKSKKKYPFGYKLMGSEWFTEVPEDLSENWLVKLCPEGVRYLVIAHRGITTCYYRNGRTGLKFKSKLPGGNNESAHKFTLLDCVYHRDLNTMFVYDVLAWNSLSLLDAEAEMRFCWLKNKFQEEPELTTINKEENFDFVIVDFFPSEVSLLQEKIATPFIVNSQELPLDGVLFYHKEGHYTFQKSPLVGWLKPFMLPEILNIDLHPLHWSKRPEDYQNVIQYIKSKKNKKKEICDQEMHEFNGDEFECE